MDPRRVQRDRVDGTCPNISRSSLAGSSNEKNWILGQEVILYKCNDSKEGKEIPGLLGGPALAPLAGLFMSGHDIPPLRFPT